MKNKFLFLVFTLTLFLFAIPSDKLYGQNWCCCTNGCNQDVVFIGCTSFCPSFGHGPALNPSYYPDEITCLPACALLPVELTYFRTETVDDDHILLTWETASETNNETFIIQRGSGTELNWETLEEIPGQGTTSFPSEYEFVDKSPYPGINYYRLKQIDFDGTTSYSETKAASLNKILEVNIWPTLAKDFISINFEKEVTDQKIMVEVFDLMGRRVILQDNSKTAIDIRNLTKGHYFVNVSMKNKRHTLRFVKVE